MRFLALLFLAFLLPCPVSAGIFGDSAPKLPADFESALMSASTATLYSIQPYGGPDVPELDFHGHHQLGHLDLQGAQAKEAISTVREAISSGKANTYSMCVINPRHGLRIVSQGNTYDFLICYECRQLEIFKNGKEAKFNGIIGGKPDDLNNILTKGNIPLADDKAALSESYKEEAKLALEKAMDGDSKAQEVLGYFYISGRGVEKNPQEGINWIAKATGASVDDPAFQYKIGMLYWNGKMDGGLGGDGLAKSREEAIVWLRKAAENGNSDAQYKFGYAEKIGEGVEKDAVDGLKWLQKSAQKGNPKAEYEIGTMYKYDRRTIKEDDAEAMRWFLKAANHGNPNAMKQLAWMYEKGEGTKADPIEAYFWDKIGTAYYSIYGTPVHVSLTKEQIAEVEARIATWKTNHPVCEDCRLP